MPQAETPSGISFIEFALMAALLSGCAMSFAPELAAAAKSAREQALEEDLEMFRRQIKQYRLDHKDQLPAHGTNSEATFVSQLTRRTSRHGEIAERAHFGPYIIGSLPVNPFSGLSRVLVVPGPLTASHTTGDGTHGWAFSSTTGEIRANTPGR
jgi:type II secretory pathway pseudopilin PulG